MFLATHLTEYIVQVPKRRFAEQFFCQRRLFDHFSQSLLGLFGYWFVHGNKLTQYLCVKYVSLVINRRYCSASSRFPLAKLCCCRGDSLLSHNPPLCWFCACAEPRRSSKATGVHDNNKQQELSTIVPIDGYLWFYL